MSGSCWRCVRTAGERLASHGMRAALLWGLLLAIADISEPPVLAQSADPVPTTNYRRIYVPEAELDGQVRGLLPIRREEFDQRIADSAPRGTGHLAPPRARLTAAQYSARLAGESLVDGKALWSVETSGSEPTVLHAAPCNLALAEAVWQASGANAASQPALVGNDPEGNLVALVPRSGTLALDWSLTATEATTERIDFRLQLPPVPLTRLEIDLPAGMVLRCNAGLVIPPASTSANRGEDRAARDAAAMAGGSRHWAIEAGGAADLSLSIERTAGTGPAGPVVLVQESGSYRIHTGEIDVTASLELDVLSAPLVELILLVDRQVDLLSVRLGDEPLAWEEVSSGESADDSSGQAAGHAADNPAIRRIAVELIRPLRGEGIKLEVAGVAPWPANQPLRLPRIQVLHGVWQEGQAVVLADPSVLVSIDSKAAGWQTSFQPATAARAVDEWRFQYFVPNEPLLAAQVASAPPLVESSGTSLTFETSQISAALTAELSVDRGECFSASAQIPAGWILDGVDVLPADAQEDRRLQTRGSGPQILQIDLRRPIIPGRPLVVTLRARRRRPATELWMSAQSLQLARFGNVRSARRLLAINLADSTVSLASRGDEQLHRLDPASLSDQERRLFPAAVGPLVVQCDQRSDAWEFRLEPARPRYQADVLVRADVQSNRLEQSVRLRCIPAGTAVARMSVRLAPPPREPVQWRIQGEEGRELTAQLRYAPSADGTREAIFDLALARPRQAPFEIEAIWTATEFDSAGSSPVVLAAFQEAETQTGSLEVYAPRDFPLVVHGERLMPAPVAGTLDPDSSNLLRGAYRYRPEQMGDVHVQVVTRRQSLPGGWVEALVLESQFLPDGFARHEATLKLHQAGPIAFAFRLPPGVNAPRAVVDDQPVTVEVVDTAAGAYRIPVPDAPSCTIRIATESQSPPLGWRVARTWTLPALSCDLPVLSARWRVSLPPELRLVDPAAGSVTRPSLGLANLPSSGDSESNLDATADSFGSVGLAGTGTQPPVELHWNRSDRATLVVYAPRRVLAWSWCLALVAGSLAWLSVTRLSTGVAAHFFTRPRSVLLMGVVAAVALLLPVYLAPLLWGTLAGVLVGVAGGSLWSQRAAPIQRAESIQERSTARRAIVSALLVAAIVMVEGRVSQVASGAAPGEELAGEGAPTRGYKVVIPIDDNRQPVGDYVFVEPPLYDLLVQRGESLAADFPAWIIRSAGYRLLEREQLSWELDVESLRPDVALRLPLVRGEVTLVEGESRLDGRPVVPRWAATDDHLEVFLAEAGRHRLEVRLAFLPRVDGSQRIAELSIPRLVVATFSAPAGSRGLKIGGHSGEMVPAMPLSLGPVNRLRMVWPIAATGPDSLPSATMTDGRLLMLWRIRPGSVVAHANVRVTPIGGEVREVNLAIDPRLRVLPLAADSLAADFVVEEGASENRLRLRLAQPAAEPLQLQFSMLWAGASGVGNLSLPQVELLTDRQSPTQTALSLAKGLAWKTEPLAAAERELADFLAAWGATLPAGLTAAEANQFVFAGEHESLVSTIPSAAPLHVLQSIDYTLASRSMAIDFAAELTQPTRELWQHQVAVPAELTVTSVVLWAGEHPVDVRWHRDTAGLVTVVTTELPVAAQRLEVKAEQPVVPGDALRALPELTYLGATVGPRTARVFRQADVDVSVTAQADGWQSLAPPDGAGPSPDRHVRLVGAFRQSDSTASPSLQIRCTANVPRCQGTLVTRLVPQGSGWEVELECQIAVASGQLDTLELELPPAFREPLTIEPAVEYEWVAREAGTHRSLLVRPAAAVTDSLQLRVRGTLQSTGPSILPQVNLPQVEPLRRLVELPAAIEGEAVHWQLAGLQPIDPASRDNEPRPPQDRVEHFEVIGEHPQAILQRSPIRAPAVRVLLAEHRVFLPAGGQQTIASLATLDILPDGQADFAVQVPPGLRLIEVLVEGRLVQPIYRGGGVWNVPLVHAASPQRIEIAAEGILHAASSGNRTRLPLVQVVGDDRSTQIVHIADIPVGQPIGRFASPEEAATIRLEQVTEARTQAAASWAANVPAEYRVMLEARWGSRWHAANEALPLTESLALSADLAARVEAAREQGALLDEVAQSGGVSGADLRAEELRRGSVVSTLADSLETLAVHGGQSYVAIGPEEIWIENPASGSKAIFPPLGWALGVVAAGWFASRLLGASQFAERPTERLLLAIAAGGLVLLIGAAQLLVATADSGLLTARGNYLLLGTIGLALVGGATHVMGRIKRSPADRSHFAERSAVR
jgi:hypothetical protein